MSYDKYIYEQAESELNRRRFINETEHQRRVKEIERRIPEIAEINSQLTQTIVDLSTLIIQKKGNFEQHFNRIRENNIQGQKMAAELLSAHGYPVDYLNEIHTCEKCSDKGYINGKRCDCLIHLLNKYSIEKLNENANMPQCDFEHFSLEYYRDRVFNGVNCLNIMESNLNTCIDYAENFSERSGSLLLYGKTGVGKTHLSLSIARRVAQKGFTVAYGSIINYLNIIEKEHFNKNNSPEPGNTMALLTETELLVLDDLGSEFNTNFYESVIYNIINTRINLGLPTIINTNLDTNELQKKYNDRIISRIFCVYKTLYCVGEDIRQIKRLENIN